MGYARGLISSRKMEQACRENVTFMALACGQRPDHSTIAAFVSSMRGEIVPLFRDVLLVCEESGLLGGTFFALDGCKLPSNASKEWSGKISDLVRKKEKMEKRVTELLKWRGGGDVVDFLHPCYISLNIWEALGKNRGALILFLSPPSNSHSLDPKSRQSQPSNPNRFAPVLEPHNAYFQCRPPQPFLGDKIKP